MESIKVYKRGETLDGRLLMGVNLEGSHFIECEFVKTDLSNTNLTEAIFEHCDFKFPILWETYLRRAQFNGCLLEVFFPLYTYRGGMIYRDCVCNMELIKYRKYGDEGRIMSDNIADMSPILRPMFPAG